MDKLRDQVKAMEDRQQQLLLERRASLEQLQWSVIGAVSIVTIFEVMTLGYVYLLNQKHSLAQEKIRRALEEENQRRRESEEALKIASDNLRRSNQDLQQFVYVASHDLQEPIRAIHGFTSILARKLEPLLTDETRKSMGQITSGAERMRTLIEGLLAYARVESRGEQFKSVDMDALINSIVQEDLKMRIEETGAQVTVEPLPVIQGDEGQLRMLFTNLISNALKYKRDEPPRVKVESVSGKHHNVISVQDNGIGFDQKHADRIFVMFQRLHSRNQYEGTGIGLALCKRVAERHGGTITAKSTPGQGSTFIVSFPKALTQSQSQESVTLTTEA
jgi:light-regulated signal transduction histidine kinase (bacteriophytochrome)